VAGHKITSLTHDFNSMLGLHYYNYCLCKRDEDVNDVSMTAM